MTEFIPFYNRTPNKIISYREEPFDDGHGHKAILTKALYFDAKKKKESEMTVRVKWIENE